MGTINKIIISENEIINTDAYANANNLQKLIVLYPYYIMAIGGWITVCKYKGLDTMLNTSHVINNDFLKTLIKELFFNKCIRHYSDGKLPLKGC